MDMFHHHPYLSGRTSHCAWGGFRDAAPLIFVQATGLSYFFFDVLNLILFI